MSANFAFRRPSIFDALRRRTLGEAPRTNVLPPADLGSGAEVGKIDPVLNGARQLARYQTAPYNPNEPRFTRPTIFPAGADEGDDDGSGSAQSGYGATAVNGALAGAQNGVPGMAGGAGGALLGKYLRDKLTSPAGLSNVAKPVVGAVGKLFGFKAGGRLTRDLVGQVIATGEAGPELVVGDDGRTQTVGQQGPELDVVQRPGTVVPTAQTRPRLALLTPTDGTPQQPAVAQPTPAPLKRFFPADMTANGLSTDTSISPEGVTPRLTRPLPAMSSEQPDRTLSVEEAQQNLAQYQRGNRLKRIDELSDPNFQAPKGQGGFKHRLVRGLKVGGEMALQNLAQTGNPASALGAFVGGDVVGTVDRRSQGRFLARRELGQLQQAEQYDLTRQGEQAKIADQQSQTALRNAQIPYWQQRPANERTKATAQALKNQQTAIKSELSVRLKDPRPFDANDAYDSDLLERAQAAGVSFDTGAFGDMKNPATMEILDPADPSGTRKTRVRYNRATGAFEPVAIGDKPVQTGYVQPVIGAGPDAGMTPTAARAARDRVAGQGETHRHNVATEGQGTERIGIARGNQVLRGTPTTVNTNTRLARGAELNRKLEEEKNKAAHPPQMILGQATSDAYRQAYTARHKAAAAGYRDQIKNGYSDIYESGADADGWALCQAEGTTERWCASWCAARWRIRGASVLTVATA
jgi:hypothetical protein